MKIQSRAVLHYTTSLASYIDEKIYDNYHALFRLKLRATRMLGVFITGASLCGIIACAMDEAI